MRAVPKRITGHKGPAPRLQGQRWRPAALIVAKAWRGMYRNPSRQEYPYDPMPTMRNAPPLAVRAR